MRSTYGRLYGQITIDGITAEFDLSVDLGALVVDDIDVSARDHADGDPAVAGRVRDLRALRIGDVHRAVRRHADRRREQPALADDQRRLAGVVDLHVVRLSESRIDCGHRNAGTVRGVDRSRVGHNHRVVGARSRRIGARRRVAGRPG